MEPEVVAAPNSLSNLVWIGMVLVMIGFILVFIGILSPILSSSERVSSGGGAVIIIGPFPIVIASNARIAKALLLLAIVFAVLVFILFFLLPYLFARTVRPPVAQ